MFFYEILSPVRPSQAQGRRGGRRRFPVVQAPAPSRPGIERPVRGNPSLRFTWTLKIFGFGAVGLLPYHVFFNFYRYIMAVGLLTFLLIRGKSESSGLDRYMVSELPLDPNSPEQCQGRSEPSPAEICRAKASPAGPRQARADRAGPSHA